MAPPENLETLLAEIPAEAGGTVYRDYSGRGMFGATCVGIEGIDGAGKTTQANLVAAELRQIGLEVVVSKDHEIQQVGQRSPSQRPSIGSRHGPKGSRY